MAERRFVKAGEYELFLDEECYNAILDGGWRCLCVSWYGWHRVWKPSRLRTRYNGRLFRRAGCVMLDLLMGREGSAVVKLQQIGRPRDSLSFVVKV